MQTSKTVLINKVKEIILKHANPTRIYLYGSHASGEAHPESDIDIAYEDENFESNYLIEDEVAALHTLIKIDVQNLSRCEDRFKNRVKSTGRVLYSATKELRAEDGLYNFSNALDRFANVVDREDEFKVDGLEDVYLDLIVKRFEFTYEMCWKALKRYLDFIGIDAKSPRAVFKESFAQGLICDEDIWLDMIESRNLSSHIYDESEIREILDKKEIYKNAFVLVRNKLMHELKKERE